jgi:hypothetical protein
MGFSPKMKIRAAGDLCHRPPHGILPLAGKVVCAFRAYHDLLKSRGVGRPWPCGCRPGRSGNHREGQAPSCVIVGSRKLEVIDYYLWEKASEDRSNAAHGGWVRHRSILRIRPAGEPVAWPASSGYVPPFRPSRGGVMGNKNLKYRDRGRKSFDLPAARYATFQRSTDSSPNEHDGQISQPGYAHQCSGA